MANIRSCISYVHTFCRLGDDNNAVKALKGVNKKLLFLNILTVQPLLHTMVLQLRGLNGSMGNLNQILSWAIVANLVFQYVLLIAAYLKERSGTDKYGIVSLLSLVWTFMSTTVCGLSIYARGTAPPCPLNFQLIDIQFCNTSAPGSIPLDNFSFLLIITVFNYEYVPIPTAFTLANLVYGYIFVLCTLVTLFDCRMLAGDVISTMLYLFMCWFVVVRIRTQWKEAAFSDSSLYSDVASSPHPFPHMSSTADRSNKWSDHHSDERAESKSQRQQHASDAASRFTREGRPYTAGSPPELMQEPGTSNCETLYIGKRLDSRTSIISDITMDNFGMDLGQPPDLLLNGGEG